MARERMVTRTISATSVKLIGMDIEKVETIIDTVSIVGEYKSIDDVLKATRKAYETDTFKVVAIQEYKVYEEMYGIYEEDFIKWAMKLDPTTRKPIA